MVERLKKLAVILNLEKTDTPEQYLEFKKQEFLAKDNIEKLVKEGRSPFSYLSSNDKELFALPPEGFNEREADNIEKIFYGTGGVIVFDFKNGNREIAETFLLSKEEAQEVNRRVLQTKERRIKL
jgi:hypothetical protein